MHANTSPQRAIYLARPSPNHLAGRRPVSPPKRQLRARALAHLAVTRDSESHSWRVTWAGSAVGPPRACSATLRGIP